MTNVKPAMLSQSVQRATPTPVTRVVEDYVDIKSTDDDENSPSKQPQGKILVRPKPKASSSSSLAPQKVHPLLASMGFKNASEIQAILRDELISLRSGGRHEGSLADWKHFYVVGTATAVSTTEASTALCAVTGGTAVNNRVTNTIGLRKLRLRYRIERVLSAAAPTAVTREPVIHVYVWRDKIPVTPGTAPTTAGTDANPPASATLMFSRLGAATVAAGDMPVRNPITEDAYHLYGYHKVTLDTHAGFNLIDAAAGTGMPGPLVKFGEFMIDLNEVQQKYATFAATASDINNLWITVHSPTSYTNQGYSDTFAFTSDIEFHDIQD